MFPARLREMRKKRGLTQEELADLVKTTKTTISNYETGYSTPSQEVLVDIANTLHTTTDYLLGRGSDSSVIIKPKNMPVEWVDLYEQINELGLELEATAILRTASGMSKETLEDVLKVLRHMKSEKKNNN